MIIITDLLGKKLRFQRHRRYVMM